MGAGQGSAGTGDAQQDHELHRDACRMTAAEFLTSATPTDDFHAVSPGEDPIDKPAHVSNADSFETADGRAAATVATTPGACTSSTKPNSAPQIDKPLDRRRFPGFEEIPGKDDIAHKWYLREEGFSVTIVEHWCLLAEITEVSLGFLRPRLDLRDRLGCKFRLHCHIRDRFATFKLEEMAVGNTLAIICPQRHYFMDGTVGIRQEDPDSMFIFHASLQNLLKDAHRQFCNLSSQICAECHKPTIKYRCKACKLVEYCSEGCIRSHWKAVHKNMCKQQMILRNLVEADFSRSPAGDLFDFVELATPQETGQPCQLQLPRPCACGFRDASITNCEECPLPGFSNHVDYPPFSCLPVVCEELDVSHQFYYEDDATTTPSRTWGLLAEVDCVTSLEHGRIKVQAQTRFGEECHFVLDRAKFPNVKARHCVLALYARRMPQPSSELILNKRSSLVLFELEQGINGLLNCEAQLMESETMRLAVSIPNHFSSEFRMIVRSEWDKFDHLSHDKKMLLTGLCGGQCSTGFRFPPTATLLPDCSIFKQLCHDLFLDIFPNEVAVATARRPNAKRDVAEREGTVPSKPPVQVHGSAFVSSKPDDSDLLLVFKSCPEGMRASILPKRYEACYGRRLDPKARGYKSLRLFLNACPNLEVQDAAPAGLNINIGSDVWVRPRTGTTVAETCGLSGGRDMWRESYKSAGNLQVAECTGDTQLAETTITSVSGQQMEHGADASESVAVGPVVDGGRRAKHLAEPPAPRGLIQKISGPLQPPITRLPPSHIRFTHDSINHKFKDGRLIRETLNQLVSGSIEASCIPKMQVALKAYTGLPEQFWAYTGNRRLWVFRQLEERGLLSEIEVDVVDKEVPQFRLTTKCGGSAVKVRGEKFIG